MNYVWLASGIVLLIVGVNMLVDAAGKIANYFKVPAFIIGLTIVAFGTSAPEATIGVVSAFKEANQLALGDVVGSSIVNILLVLGLSAIAMPVEVNQYVLKRQIPLLFFVEIALLIMILTQFSLARWEGALLVCGFILFIWQMVLYAKKTKEGFLAQDTQQEEIAQLLRSQEIFAEEITEEESKKTNIVRGNLWMQAMRFVVGLALLITGAQLAVNHAVAIAQAYHLSKEFIGLTIIAIGTSLPEIATTFVASLRGENEIAIGNIVGSNIFNILFVLGLSSSITAIYAQRTIFIDIAFMIATTVLLFVTAYLHKDISRRDGIIYVILYIIYISLKSMGIV
jgi:cation:H+ antiporter